MTASRATFSMTHCGPRRYGLKPIIKLPGLTCRMTPDWRGTARMDTRRASTQGRSAPPSPGRSPRRCGLSFQFFSLDPSGFGGLYQGRGESGRGCEAAAASRFNFKVCSRAASATEAALASALATAVAASPRPWQHHFPGPGCGLAPSPPQTCVDAVAMPRTRPHFGVARACAIISLCHAEQRHCCAGRTPSSAHKRLPGRGDPEKC